MVFGWLKGLIKRKEDKKEEEFPKHVTAELPEDLERFKVREPEPVTPVRGPQKRKNYPKPLDLVGRTEKNIETEDKMDLILQKLETIDVRLKLLEEKLGV